MQPFGSGTELEIGTIAISIPSRSQLLATVTRTKEEIPEDIVKFGVP